MTPVIAEQTDAPRVSFERTETAETPEAATPRRPARSRGRGKPAPEAVTVETTAPAQPAPEAAMVVREREPRRERNPRPERRPEAQAAAPAPRPVVPETELRSRGVQSVRPREDDDRRVVGFGGDLPAFLAKPLPKRAAVKDGED